MNTQSKTTATAAEKMARLAVLRAELLAAATALDEKRARAFGVTPAERKALAREVAEGEAELSMIVDELTAIEKALPGEVEAEAEAAAVTWVRETAEQIKNEDLPAIQAAKEAADAGVKRAAELVVAVDTLRRSVNPKVLGIEIAGMRFGIDIRTALEGLHVPGATDHARPLLEAVSALGDGTRNLRPPVVVRGGRDSPEQAERDRNKALAGWLPRHAHSLPPALQGILALAPVPNWETDAQKTKRETEAAEKAEADRRFCEQASGERARSATRPGF